MIRERNDADAFIVILFKYFGVDHLVVFLDLIFCHCKTFETLHKNIRQVFIRERYNFSDLIFLKFRERLTDIIIDNLFSVSEYVIKKEINQVKYQ